MKFLLSFITLVCLFQGFPTSPVPDPDPTLLYFAASLFNTFLNLFSPLINTVLNLVGFAADVVNIVPTYVPITTPILSTILFNLNTAVSRVESLTTGVRDALSQPAPTAATQICDLLGNYSESMRESCQASLNMTTPPTNTTIPTEGTCLETVEQWDAMAQQACDTLQGLPRTTLPLYYVIPTRFANFLSGLCSGAQNIVSDMVTSTQTFCQRHPYVPAIRDCYRAPLAFKLNVLTSVRSFFRTRCLNIRVGLCTNLAYIFNNVGRTFWDMFRPLIGCYRPLITYLTGCIAAQPAGTVRNLLTAIAACANEWEKLVNQTVANCTSNSNTTNTTSNADVLNQTATAAIDNITAYMEEFMNRLETDINSDNFMVSLCADSHLNDLERVNQEAAEAIEACVSSAAIQQEVAADTAGMIFPDVANKTRNDTQACLALPSTQQVNCLLAVRTYCEQQRANLTASAANMCPQPSTNGTTTDVAPCIQSVVANTTAEVDRLEGLYNECLALA